MMHNIESLVLAEAMVRAGENAVTRAQENLERNRVILHEETHKVMELITPTYIVALGKFFAKKYFQPNLNTVCMTFDVPARKVQIDVVLKGQDGLEPADYFTPEDIAVLSEDFALCVDPKLAELNIPLTFGGFLFPEEYLQK